MEKDIFLRASLGTPISQGISIFPKKISSFSHRKIEIPWEIEVPKQALNVCASRIGNMC
jgi:hypothetical protein